MDKSIPTDRSRPHQMSHSAVGSPTQYKSFAATVRSAIRSPASRDWAATIQAVTSPTKTATSASAKSKPNEKEPKKPITKDYGFKEQVALVKKSLPLDKVKATDSFASPRPSKATTQDNTPESKASASKGSTPTIARLGSNPYLLYQFVADQSLSQSAPNTNDKAASLTKEIEEHVKTIAEKEKEIEQLKASIQENLDKIQKQDKDLAQLNETSSINEKSLKEACEKLNIKLVQCEQQIADLKMKIEKLNEEHAKIITQMKAEEAKRVSEWKDKAVELEKRVKILESEASIHGKTNEEVQQKETEILQLKGQLTEQENEIKRMKDRNINLEEQLSRFDNDLGIMIRKSEDKLKLEISQLKGIIKTLEGEIAHYKEINAKSEQLTKETSLNNAILEEKEAKIGSLEAEIRHLVSEKELAKKNEQQINEATELINEFNRNFQIAPQSELIPALHMLLAEFAKSQERVSTENEVQTQRTTTDEHDDIVKNEFEDKIKMFQSEKSELMRKLEEAEALINLNKNQQNEVTDSVPLSDRDEEDHKHREFEFEEKISVRELIIESKEEKPKSKVVILNEGSRRSSTKSTLEPQKKKSSCELSLKSQKKYSSTLSTVSTASKAESHKEVKKMREEDPVYKQLEKMIKDLTERVVSSDQKARKIYEEKLDEISNEQYAKEQVLLEQMEKLKEEKKELLKKIDDMQWDKAYEFMKKAKEEKKQEAKPLETASKPKQAALDASKKKKKK